MGARRCRLCVPELVAAVVASASAGIGPTERSGLRQKAAGSIEGPTRSAGVPAKGRSAQRTRLSLLLVFLVGETPTAGVHRTEWANALYHILTIRPAEKELRIVGPNFSGSLRPLAADLLALPAQYTGLKSHFVSGVATNYQAGKDFNDALGGRAKLEFVVENDALAGRLFIDFLEWQCLRSLRIAVLAEDEAEYGKFFPPLSKGREVEKSHSGGA